MCFNMESIVSRTRTYMWCLFPPAHIKSLCLPISSSRILEVMTPQYGQVNYSCFLPYRNTLKHNLSFPVTVLSVGIMCFYMVGFDGNPTHFFFPCYWEISAQHQCITAVSPYRSTLNLQLTCSDQSIFNLH